jgi:hypothetical protein
MRSAATAYDELDVENVPPSTRFASLVRLASARIPRTPTSRAGIDTSVRAGSTSIDTRESA